MADDRYRKVPSARFARAAMFGQMAGSVAGGMLAEGARRLARGERPQLSDLLLTPASARRVTDQLSRLRGAAMKLGQMVSMDGGEMLPPELSAILAQLRDNAHFMPPAQLSKVLSAQWGPDWRTKFARFEATPIAAASIGQVHRATLPDGRVIAIKVQYPGIADSIDADVDNVATLLRVSALLPAGLEIGALLTDAKRQLHEETDYVREAEQMQRYAALLADNPAFIVPKPIAEFSGPRVLAMDYISGQPIEALASAPQAVRDAAMQALLGLLLRELFEFGVMQTDPNFANYRWQDSGRIVLLDFGAARAVSAATSAAYRRLLLAGLAEDRAGVQAALVELGFFTPAALDRHAAAFGAIIDGVLAHLGRPGSFDFADRSFVAALRGHAQTIAQDRAAWHVPPADTLFVQRKVSGTALLAVKLQARAPLRDMVEAVLAQAH